MLFHLFLLFFLYFQTLLRVSGNRQGTTYLVSFSALAMDSGYLASSGCTVSMVGRAGTGACSWWLPISN